MHRFSVIKILSLALLLFSFALTVQAQPGKRKERIEAAKIGYLTERLDLSPDQAKVFWPVYNEFEEQRRELKRKSKVFKDEQLETLSDEQIRDGLTQIMDYRQKEVNLEKTYLEKFLKIMPPRQVAILFRSEKEFMHMLLQKLDDRKHGNNPPSKAPEPKK